ncbi:hypothetical protein [Paenibacillus sp. KS1]|uniref:hypothetical protein n=1 Tax=Paenibacillus sp. KS1 TaxID=1849249 RepID=UPI000AFF38F3|nr:hypothetical protein [Paenibacillus sp. KS1]
MRERLFLVIVYGFLIGFALICFIPFWIVLINSFANESYIQTAGYQLFPTSFSLDAYAMLLSGEQVFRSYGVTLFVTITGTVLGVLLTASYAYVLSHPKVKYRNILSFLTFFTMLLAQDL